MARYRIGIILAVSRDTNKLSVVEGRDLNVKNGDLRIDLMSGVLYHRIGTLANWTRCHDVCFEFFPLYRIKNENDLKGLDAVWYNRMVSNEALLWKCKQMGLKIIADFDDFWRLNSTHSLFNTYKEENIEQRILSQLKYADIVTCTTNRLRDKLLKFVNVPVVIVPNSINKDEEQWVYKREESNVLRVGVVCGIHHKGDIDILRGNLPSDSRIRYYLCGYSDGGMQRLMLDDIRYVERVKDASANAWNDFERIVSRDYEGCSHLYKDFLQLGIYERPRWTLNEPYQRIYSMSVDKYADAYDELDVLLVPLAKSEFNSYKSELKIVEASAKRVAVICSDVYPYNQRRIKDNGGVVFVDNYHPKRWRREVLQFLDAEYLKNKKGEVAKICESEYYCFQNRVALFTEIVKYLIDQ